MKIVFFMSPPKSKKNAKNFQNYEKKEKIGQIMALKIWYVPYEAILGVNMHLK